ncbi:MaoC/PaaZ C-terminal domain-containing protein [Desertibaculum subflavum]|uniref:MaoC/PaaZ C-terminal domain-containing protein n=1 Tax=Desertibaculum subflavum TaxID=2268458 RepID=UPI000E6698FA
MSDISSFAGWLERPPGTIFPQRTGSLTAAAQARQHAACDLPASLSAGDLDPTLLGQDMVLMASAAGLAVDGRVHLAHRIVQRAPLRIDAGYRIGGSIERLVPVPRGHEVEISAAAEPALHAMPIMLAATYLLPGLAPSGPAAPASEASTAPVTAATTLGRLDLTPERVMSYSADVGNLLHFDPAFAAARGFRAPIAQGLMLVTAFLGALARARGAVPERFELTARFRRPTFWDDRLEFHLDDERWCCIAADGRILVDGKFSPAEAPS